MKAIINTSMMLMAMTIGTLEASAQSARQAAPKNVERKSSVRSADATQNRTAQAIDSRTITTTRNNPRSDYRSPVESNTYRKNLDNNVSRKVYTRRQPNRSNNSKSSRWQSTGYRHNYKNNYYPGKRVKIHVHPTTYKRHYRVMYYPAHREIIWTHRMHRHYSTIYPGIHLRYNSGYRIQTISAFDARYNVGEISRVYGRVYGTWFNRETDDLLLFFGGEYPFQDFTMVVPGHIARKYSWRPERFFLGQHVHATGFISSYNGKPEMILKKRDQLDVY